MIINNRRGRRMRGDHAEFHSSLANFNPQWASHTISRITYDISLINLRVLRELCG